MEEPSHCDAILDDWFLVRIATDHAQVVFACGTVWHDRSRRFKNGQTIRTSLILTATELIQEGRCIQTCNSVYFLGKPFSGASWSMH